MASFAPLGELITANGRHKKRINYIYDSDIGNFAYETGHPMKPHRIRLAHSLVMNYGLYKKMEIYRAKPASSLEMTQFHTNEYIDFLKMVTPDNMHNYVNEQNKFNVGGDSPIFDGLFDFCAISAGGSMEGAARLNRGKCDIAINWAGGLHHAKKGEGSGFCYVNVVARHSTNSPPLCARLDIVLAILELLRFHQRVLYIDIDVHHGDGVEEAFYTTDRVMTASFHRFGEFFPGTGELRDIGVGQGKHYSVNFPLRDGIDDVSYKAIFEPVIEKIIEHYRPGAVVLQCGADSLSGDRLGSFNLSMRGHANCVKFVKSFNLPTLVLGGGGYTMNNVARTWAFETGVILDQPMDPVLPYNEYYQYYAPTYELDVRPSNASNANSRDYLNKITTSILENLKMVAFAPSVQMMDVPRDPVGMDEEADAESDDYDEDENNDVRYTQHRRDKMIVDDDGLVSDSDGDNDEKRPKKRLRRNVANYQSPITIQYEEEMTGQEITDSYTKEHESSINGTKLEKRVAQEDAVPQSPSSIGINSNILNLKTSESTSELMDLYGDTMIVDVPTIPHEETPRYTLLEIVE
ncbi:hypothetical protein B7463_g878, partial [Scytalidium lignicola]